MATATTSRRAVRSTVAVLLLLGCGGVRHPRPDAASPSPSPSPATASPTLPHVAPSPVQSRAIVAAYRSYWTAVETAWRTDDPAARLAATATGRQLATITGRLTKVRAAGRSLRGTVSLRPRVEWVLDTGLVAHLRDCQDGSRFLVYDRTGRPLGRGVPRTDLAEVDLLRVDGVWKVEHVNTTSGVRCPF